MEAVDGVTSPPQHDPHTPPSGEERPEESDSACTEFTLPSAARGGERTGADSCEATLGSLQRFTPDSRDPRLTLPAGERCHAAANARGSAGISAW